MARFLRHSVVTAVSGGARHFVGGTKRDDRGAEGMERGVWGGGYAPSAEFFFQYFIKNGVFWSILMSKCASHVYTCIAYFHFDQYKPTS